MTTVEIAQRVGVARQNVIGAAERARVNLGARTLMEAIALAVLHGDVHLPGYDQRVEQARRHVAAAARMLGAAG